VNGRYFSDFKNISVLKGSITEAARNSQVADVGRNIKVLAFM
jgi:hypothetical protein